MVKKLVSVAFFGVLCTLTTGCGGGGIQADGKVVKEGVAYTPAEGEGINISLVGNETSVSASVQQDGTFTLRGSEGKGIREGKYKVSVVRYAPPAGGKGPAAPVTKDYPEEWSINSRSKSFTLDLAKLK